MDATIIALGLLSQLLLLAVAMALGQFLERRKIRWLSEAALAILVGITFGLVTRLAGVEHKFKEFIVFKVDIFMFLLLPPIMFNAGFSVNVPALQRNFVGLTLFAFAGTTISMFFVGVTMWLAGSWGLCYKMDLLKCLLFGSMISATDPVTVLAVFNRLGAERNIYSMVFGESVLNDAVGMVLYETLERFVKHDWPVDAAGVFKGIGIFFAIFIGSTLIGGAVGAVASLVARTSYFETPPTYSEPSIFIVVGLSSYLIAQACHGSGIVAVFFCGIIMQLYVKPHMSSHGRTQVQEFWEVANSLAETFVFIYIGTLLFITPQGWDHWRFTAVCIFALGPSRAANIFPLSLLTNKIGKSKHSNGVSGRQQFMLWWSGLRGGMAAALALQAEEDFGQDGKVMMTATFFSAVITVLVNGGSSSRLLQYLELQEDKLAHVDAPVGVDVQDVVKELDSH